MNRIILRKLKKLNTSKKREILIGCCKYIGKSVLDIKKLSDFEVEFIFNKLLCEYGGVSDV